jgi:ATP-binding cassette, subfamily F, member 3
MIHLRNIGIRFGEEPLFQNVSLNIGTRERIGLVGANGTGKTTLLRIIDGAIEPHTGNVERAKTASVGFLPQEVVRMKGKTLYDEVALAFSDVLETQRNLEDIQRELEREDISGEERTELIEQMGTLQQHLEMSDAFRMKSSIEKVLMGLGFREEQFTWMTEHFSGGWQMRIELAKLLLRQPSLILLDEPTNHLDLNSLRWLEEYLRSYKGSLILVSHDRTFLDTMCTHIWELSLGTLTTYTGNYSRYVVQKEERKQLLESAYKNQQRQLKQTERFIERFRYKNTKARQVQSRIKQLEKIERIELEDEESEISFHFPPPPRSGAFVVRLRDVVKRYDTVEVFNGIDFSVERGDRIAFVGVNGAGKSTLARIIAGVEPLTHGERELGYNVLPGYFAQNQAEELDLSATPASIIDAVAEGEIRKYTRTLLGCFLFRGDDVFKQVRVLSGGEKSRLALAKMLLKPANFLILDEPTNHLDMRSKEILRTALLEFDGSYVIVSHDRAFLEGIVDKVVEFRHGGILKEYPGSLEDYLIKVDGRQEETIPEPVKEDDDKRRNDKDRKRREAEIRQQRYSETRPLSGRLSEVERNIHELEERIKTLERKLMDETLYNNPDDARTLNHEYSEYKGKVEELYRDWEDLSVKLDKIHKKYDTMLNEYQKRR